MYQKNDPKDAAAKILTHIDKRYPQGEFDWIYEKFDKSWKRMLNIMEGKSYAPLYRN